MTRMFALQMSLSLIGRLMRAEFSGSQAGSYVALVMQRDKAANITVVPKSLLKSQPLSVLSALPPFSSFFPHLPPLFSGNCRVSFSFAFPPFMIK